MAVSFLCAQVYRIYFQLAESKSKQTFSRKRKIYTRGGRFGIGKREKLQIQRYSKCWLCALSLNVLGFLIKSVSIILHLIRFRDRSHYLTIAE